MVPPPVSIFQLTTVEACHGKFRITLSNYAPVSRIFLIKICPHLDIAVTPDHPVSSPDRCFSMAC